MSILSSIKEQFTFIKVLYEGNDSLLWLVESKSNHNYYVLKILNQINLPISQIQRINCNGIPKLYRIIEDEKHTYIIEEYIQGKTLEQIINSKSLKKINENDIKDIFISLCKILKLLHDDEIVHQDIKLSNILMSNSGEIKLIDFDSATEFGFNNLFGKKKNGTEGFAAPEQYMEDKLIDGRTDIYALGVTIRQLLPENYKGDLRAVIAKCVEFDANNRFQTVDEIIDALENRKKIKLRKHKYGKVRYSLIKNIAYIFFYILGILNSCIFIPAILHCIFHITTNPDFVILVILCIPFIIYSGLRWQRETEMKLIYQKDNVSQIIYFLIHIILSSGIIFYLYLDFLHTTNILDGIFSIPVIEDPIGRFVIISPPLILAAFFSLFITNRAIKGAR